MWRGVCSLADRIGSMGSYVFLDPHHLLNCAGWTSGTRDDFAECSVLWGSCICNLEILESHWSLPLEVVISLFTDFFFFY